MVRSYARSVAMLKNAKANVESHWVGPNLHTIDVNWAQVSLDTDAISEHLLGHFYRSAQFNTASQIAQLALWVEVTKHNNTRFQKLMRDAQKQTMANLEKALGRDEVALTLLRGTRDLSAEFVMVSATAVTGGLATAGTVGFASALKATARYEDDPTATKGNIAATFATEFAVGMLDIKVGKAIEEAAKGTRTGLAILWAQAKGMTIEPAKAVLQGKTIQEGLLTGGMKSVSGIHGEILKLLVFGDKKFEMTAAIFDSVISYGADKVSDYLSEQNKGENAEQKSTRVPEQPDIEESDQALLDALAHDRDVIDQVAIRKIGSVSPQMGSGLPAARLSPGLRRL
jgi:hypothetical protein